MKCSFIVSTGRTGTQSLAKILEEINGDRIAAYHEPVPSRIFRILSTLRAAGVVSDGFTLACIRVLRNGLVYRGDHAIYVESNNFLFGLCDLLADNFEGSRVLHIVRDPRSYTESHLRHGVFSGLKGVFSCFMPYWLIKPRHLGIKTKRPWLFMSQHQRLFWFWALVNRVIYRSCAELGENYRVVRFEDLFSDKELFVDVLLWLGLSEDKAESVSDRISERHNEGTQSYEKISGSYKEVLQEICGDQASYYGYQL